MSWPTGYVPVLPLKNTVIYPDVSQALRVGREKSLKALQAAFERGHWILTFTQREELKIENEHDFHEVGVLAKIESVKGQAESGYQVVLKGYKRVRRVSFRETRGYFEALFEPLDDHKEMESGMEKALLSNLRELSLEILKPNQAFSDSINHIDDMQELTYLIAAHADFPVNDKQKVLDIDDLKDRVMCVLGLLHNVRESLNVQADIRNKLNNRFGQNQRQQILREQLRAIKEELGEGEEQQGDQYQKKIDELNLPKEALDLAQSQLKRLQEINPSSPEYHVTKNHLDFMLALPWNKTSQHSDIDLQKAQEVLDADHFGLEKVKKRILQHLAVMKLTQGKKGSILLLLGPPGVGKTSLGQSIAKALGRQYVRASLGGIRDDAEIRGHRRTYVGALPGRILASIKKAGEKDPVIILDEIDKMSRGFTGDPASAMLEVLDPEQNSTFMDHYLDTSFDLSKVFFIGTANSLDGIQGPLLDRMEVVELGSYTSAEKMQIAKTHLLPKQMREHGLTEEHLQVPDEVLMRIQTHFTREAGVRELQRRIAEVCRWVSERVVLSKDRKVKIEISDLEEILGSEKFNYDTIRPHQGPGVVAGLAWTPVGGDLLYIEAAMMPGQGKLTATGQLGDVMKESASIALSLLKSRMAFFNPTFDFSKYDLHVHAPAGAIPKDGPSAGVTLFTALASLLTGREVPKDRAMTGEITLTGAVLPVGGIKEKLIAAHRNGAYHVLIPKANERDLKNLSDEVRSELKVELAENVNQVLKWALDLDFPNGMVGVSSPQRDVTSNEPSRPAEMN